jgi:hypothetical protein
MIHHIVLVKIKSDTPSEKVEEMMVESRIRLLKIPEILNLQCGKKTDGQNQYDFFFSIDVENTSKLKIVESSAIFLQFKQQVLDPNIQELSTLDYETEPGKDVTFS